MITIEQKIIPQGWQLKRFGDLVSIRTGKKDANAQVIGGGYPFFTCAQGVSEIDNYTFDTEAVIVAGNGDFNVKYYNGKFDAYQRTYVIETKNDLIPIFLYYGAQYALPRITSGARGSTIQYLKIGDFTEFQFLVPPIQEQKKIAEILSTVDAEIEKVEGIISHTKKLKGGLMRDLFTKGTGHKKFKKTKIGEIPENWEIVKGEDVSEIITKGASPRWQGFEYQKDGSLFVTSENVRNGVLNIDNPKFLPLQFHEKLKNSQLKNDDILINIVGASIGRSCLYKSNYLEANINQAVCLLRPNEKVLPLFILQFLQNQQTIDRLLGAQNGSARQNLSLTDIRNFLFILPSKIEQKKIAEILLSVDEKILINTRYREALMKLKKGLMQDLLSGKIRTKK